MKILHCPVPIARQPWLLSRAQRKLGAESDVMIFRTGPYWELDSDYNFHLEKYQGRMQKLVAASKAAVFVPKALIKYDVFHFHTKSILPNWYDAIIAKKLGKRIVFQIHGCEARLSNNHGFCKICQSYGRKYKLKTIEMVNKLGHLVIVVTPDLLNELPNATWIPDSIDLELWKPGGNQKKDDIVRIVHASSDPEVKGTAYIQKAVQNLKKDGYKVELLFLTNVPNTKVREFCLQADIAVDQLLIGSYGVNAIETMAMGIPTCAFIREDLVEKYPNDLPLMNASKDNIEEKLRMLIEDKKLREKIGKRSVSFANEYHDHLKNGGKLLKMYEEIKT